MKAEHMRKYLIADVINQNYNVQTVGFDLSSFGLCFIQIRKCILCFWAVSGGMMDLCRSEK